MIRNEASRSQNPSPSWNRSLAVSPFLHVKDAIFSLHTSLLPHASKYTSINTYMHYITLRYSYSCSCSCSYSYICRQCIALHVHIPNPDIIPKRRSGRWFPISMIPLHFCTSFQYFCWFPSSSGTWNFYVQSGVSSFWCRPLVTLVLKRRRHTLGRKVAGLFGTLGRCDSLSSRFC